jgi:hypothetical protein
MSLNIVYTVNEAHKQYCLLDTIFIYFVFWNSRNISINKSKAPAGRICGHLRLYMVQTEGSNESEFTKRVSAPGSRKS